MEFSGGQNRVENDFTLGDSDASESPIKKRPLKRVPRWKTIFIYVSSSLVAFFLTLLCPGTLMWNGGTGDSLEGQTTATLNQECLFELIVVWVITIVAFFSVHNSDPGYLNEYTLRSNNNKQNGAVMLDGRGELVDENSSCNRVEGRNHKEAKELHRRLQTSQSIDDLPYYNRLFQEVCQTCNIMPPLRAHHCRICDKCVATFDHHCLFIGTCIGERNHCRFWWFLTFQLFGLWRYSSVIESGPSVLFIARVVARNYSENKELLGHAVIILSKLYVYPLMACALIMWVFHSLLALCNVTTYEFVKGPRELAYLKGTKECDFPFSRGPDSNIRMFCCFRDEVWSSLSGTEVLNNRVNTYYDNDTYVGQKNCKRRRSDSQWNPIFWKMPQNIYRDSDDCWENPWQNKYYSCC
uniref:Palmitoyltransferase n=1 Tax=Proboscia inermis TaxID=420281 RepID=A0A7S0GL60_9STRA|mmetsp:Transcript_683/g.739  ORF Transcript_683/g.739 Transcript_683/m.739 type:complete len:410 (+) Transcript_683:91-1320(+)